jgi:CubicO group peptidase (beta-lactamase class C family)
MMKKSILFLLILFFSCQEDKIDCVSNTKKLPIISFLNGTMQRENPREFNGSIIIKEGNSIVYEYYKGFANIELKTKIDSTSQFAIGSVSKQITAVIVLREVQNGRLKLDDEITKYLPKLDSTKYKNITIHQLLNHSSGISTLNASLEFKPGTDFYYSNTGYNLLGEIVEKTSKKSFDELVLILFKEAKMLNSTTANLYSKGSLVCGYDGKIGKKISKIENLTKHLSSSKIGIPAGGIISTAKDLILWNEFLHQGNALNKEFYAKMMGTSSQRDHPIWGKVNYGYGIQNSKEYPKEYFHSGYIRGFPSLNLYFPETKTSIIILENIAYDAMDFDFIFDIQVQLRNLYRTIEKGNLEGIKSVEVAKMKEKE